MEAGLVIVDKPAGMTSHDVVARLRRILRTRKVGHAGTLDPMATGVLVCGVERGTKLLGHLALDTKAYTGTIRLGAATTTDDAEGEVLSTADPSDVTDAAIAVEVAALTGPIDQVPSSVSAIKVNGQRAYARVRAGEQVVLAARPVTVSTFDIWRAAAPTWTCSSSARRAPTCGPSRATWARGWASGATYGAAADQGGPVHPHAGAHAG